MRDPLENARSSRYCRLLLCKNLGSDFEHTPNFHVIIFSTVSSKILKAVDIVHVLHSYNMKVISLISSFHFTFHIKSGKITHVCQFQPNTEDTGNLSESKWKMKGILVRF